MTPFGIDVRSEVGRLRQVLVHQPGAEIVRMTHGDLSRLLFDAHPGWREGELTRARSALVNTRALARQARRLGVPDELVLGRT